MFEKTINVMESFREMGLPGYDLIVYKDGKQIFRHWNGYSDLENRIPMTGTERYNIYSCSKPITCVAAMQLWEKGLFSLEDPLSKYIPEFAEMTVQTPEGIKKAEKPILIKHLFEMTAGFSYDCGCPAILRTREETGGRCPTVQTIRNLASEPLCFEPGAQWNYSLCHDVLAAVVEVISGVRFGEYVKQNIFDPLGMKNSTFLLPEEEVEGLAAQYRFNAELGVPVNCGKQIQTYKLGSEYESGGAGCISTAEDYIKFLEALRVGDVILKKDTIQFMATDRLNDAQKATYWDQDWSYGLGLRCPKENGKTTDFGWGGAAGAFLAVDIPNGLTLYYAQHMLSSPYSNRLTYESVLEELGCAAE